MNLLFSICHTLKKGWGKKATFFHMPNFLKVLSKNNLHWNKGKRKETNLFFQAAPQGRHSEKRRHHLNAIPAIFVSQFHQPKSYFPAHHPVVPLITTFRLPLFPLFNRPGGQPLLNSPNRVRLTHGRRLQAVEKPQEGVIDEL